MFTAAAAAAQLGARQKRSAPSSPPPPHTHHTHHTPNTNSPFKERAVKGGEKLDLGGGHELEFVLAPNLHWPDTMFSYDAKTGVLFTCDAFGMHYCAEEPFDADVQAIMPHYR